ncbi:MAG: 16S rRNA (cytidine(1402)-2'-O)-methyltransferase [Desulfobacteraceae bacterium]|nr:16S rRNA (cytidine(1402)-2'-O)-methyltransferase [Desulfobacteraceae bacterium]
MPLNLPTPEPLAPGLYVVTTPIGNRSDITMRALSVLAQVELIAAEDTRHTRRLLAAHGIENQLISYHEHNEVQRAEMLAERLSQGAAIAVVSNAGTPTVSDPGYRLVCAAVARGVPVYPIPGVSAAVTALSVSGLPSDQFTFVGFPARKKNRRAEQLKALAQVPHTLIFYQSPQRLLEFVEEVKEIFGDRAAVLAREMTKVHEEFIRGALSELLRALKQKNAIKGECTLLVAGASPADPDAMEEEDLDQAILTGLGDEELSLKDLSKNLAQRFNLGRKQIYDRALMLQKSASKSES